jgi:hypothetical protein
MHIYRDYKHIYCSWTCYNHRNDSKAALKTKTVGQYTPTGELVRTFRSARDAADITGHELKGIRLACLQNLTYFGYKWRYEE